MSQISEKDYREYLIGLKNMTYKILPLYEEQNPHILDYIDSVCTEIKGLKNLIENLPYGIWYVKTLATLEALKIESGMMDQKKKIKKEVFRILDVIDKQIDQLKGE